MKKLFLTFCLLFTFFCCYAQKGTVFGLSKLDSGHYIMSLKLNNSVKAKALLESGIHALLLDSAFVFENYDKLGIGFSACRKNEKINLGGRVYRISHTADTVLLLNGDTMYKGEIFLLVDFNEEYEAALPIQNLYNSNGERVVKLDLARRQLRVLQKYTVPEKGWSEFNINRNSYLNMPAMETELHFEGKGYNASLKGNFNLDLGNASLLFLLEHNMGVKKFLCDNPDIKLQKGYDKRGRVVAMAFAPEALLVGDMRFEKPAIAVTGLLPKFTTEGILGLKFFIGVTAIFDFDRGVCYMQKN